jgi:hypothetical protein
MAILTVQEAREALGYEPDQDMPGRVTSILLPAVDQFLRDATGHDWASDALIDPTAKMAASVLLVRWFEDPAQVGKNSDIGVVSLIAQLQSKAMVMQDETA